MKVLKVDESKSQKDVYKIELSLVENTEIIITEKKRAGRFILATNMLDSQQLSNEEMFKAYREQQAPERGLDLSENTLLDRHSRSPKNFD